MSFSVLKASLLLTASGIGFYLWWQGGFSRDAGYGVFMLSVVALLAGLHMILQSFGVNLFGKDGSGESVTSLFDNDGDGGDGD